MPSLVVHYLPPNPNQTRGQHWAVAKKHRDTAGKHVLAAWSQAGRPRADGRHAVVSTTIIASGRPDDLDNRTARLKGCIDQLVSLGVLEDDSPTWLTLNPPSREKGVRGKPEIHFHINYQEAA